MTTDPTDLLESVLSKTTTIVTGIRPEQRSLPTPCPDFDVESELAHVVAWLEFFTVSAEGGEQRGDPGEAKAVDDPVGAVTDSARRAVAAFRSGAADRSLRLTQGELPGTAVRGMMLMEYVGHGWDLATATGQPAPYTEEEAQAALDAAEAMLTPEWRGPHSFADAVAVPADATTLERLIAFLGRDPR